MTDNIIKFEDVKPKPTVKEKIKNWWTENKWAIFEWATFVGIVFVLPISIGVIGMKSLNSAKSDEDDAIEYERDDDGFEGFDRDDINPEYGIDYYDPGIIDGSGYTTKTIGLETDYSNIGNLGEQIIKHFDVDPDITPYISIEFMTFSKEKEEAE